SGSVDERRDRQAEDVRHRRDRRPVALVMDKDRPDQVSSGQHRLRDQLARPGLAAVPPQTRRRIGGQRRQEQSHGITPEIEAGKTVLTWMLSDAQAAASDLVNWTRAPLLAA